MKTILKYPKIETEKEDVDFSRLVKNYYDSNPKNSFSFQDYMEEKEAREKRANINFLLERLYVIATNLMLLNFLRTYANNLTIAQIEVYYLLLEDRVKNQRYASRNTMYDALILSQSNWKHASKDYTAFTGSKGYFTALENAGLIEKIEVPLEQRRKTKTWNKTAYQLVELEYRVNERDNNPTVLDFEDLMSSLRRHIYGGHDEPIIPSLKRFKEVQNKMTYEQSLDLVERYFEMLEIPPHNYPPTDMHSLATKYFRETKEFGGKNHEQKPKH